MTRFAGVIGYGESRESAPGSGDFMDVIVERPYSGRIIRNSRRIQAADQINFDLVLQNSIEIVADPYARDSMDKLRYIKYRGKKWTVSEVIDQYPRLVLRLGEIYNGTTPVVAP